MSNSPSPKKIVLAYSGGLDTSVILPWLKSRYPGVKLVAFAAELGQGSELKGIEKKAYKSGADEVVVKDLRKEFAEEVLLPDAARARHLRNRLSARHEHRASADREAPGAGRASDRRGRRGPRRHGQGERSGPLRADRDGARSVAADHLALEGSAVSRRWIERSRDGGGYAEKHKIPITQTKKKIYSQDRNLWHISHEGAEIEDPKNEPLEQVYTITVPVAKAPDKAQYVEIEFKEGTPVAVDGTKYKGRGHELIEKLNEIGGKHAVGQVTLVENRLVGMKSRGVYETPGGTILYEAHKALEQLCLERDLYHYKNQVAIKYGELVYYGQWFHPLREALQAFVDQANETITGKVRVKLFKGRAAAVSATSPTSLYDTKLASFAMKDYDVTAARGFIDLFGLPMKVRAMRRKASK